MQPGLTALILAGLLAALWDGSLVHARPGVIVESKGLCEPGTSFKERCNTCFCGEDGYSKGCTLMLCWD